MIFFWTSMVIKRIRIYRVELHTVFVLSKGIGQNLWLSVTWPYHLKTQENNFEMSLFGYFLYVCIGTKQSIHFIKGYYWIRSCTNLVLGMGQCWRQHNPEVGQLWGPAFLEGPTVIVPTTLMHVPCHLSTCPSLSICFQELYDPCFQLSSMNGEIHMVNAPQCHSWRPQWEGLWRRRGRGGWCTVRWQYVVCGGKGRHDGELVVRGPLGIFCRGPTKTWNWHCNWK